MRHEPVVTLRRICRTCRYWNESVDGDCLEINSPNWRSYTAPIDSCRWWECCPGDRPRPDPVLCSICDTEIKVPDVGYVGTTYESRLAARKAERRIPLCDKCGHCLARAGETAWYRRDIGEGTPTEMFSLIRKLKECHSLLRRAANGQMDEWPFKGSNGETRYGS